ncbi:hypothetical protein EK904_007537 [Melospiza melodia maxima]|nr:hypothetical protein EK904_007537 [Melospiza melodia maxima]
MPKVPQAGAWPEPGCLRELRQGWPLGADIVGHPRSFPSVDVSGVLLHPWDLPHQLVQFIVMGLVLDGVRRASSGAEQISPVWQWLYHLMYLQNGHKYSRLKTKRQKRTGDNNLSPGLLCWAQLHCPSHNTWRKCHTNRGSGIRAEKDLTDSPSQTIAWVAHYEHGEHNLLFQKPAVLGAPPAGDVTCPEQEGGAIWRYCRLFLKKSGYDALTPTTSTFHVLQKMLPLENSNRLDKSERLPWEARAPRSNKQNHTSILPAPVHPAPPLQKETPNQNNNNDLVLHKLPKPGMDLISQDAAHKCQPPRLYVKARQKAQERTTEGNSAVQSRLNHNDDALLPYPFLPHLLEQELHGKPGTAWHSRTTGADPHGSSSSSRAIEKAMYKIFKPDYSTDTLHQESPSTLSLEYFGDNGKVGFWINQKVQEPGETNKALGIGRKNSAAGLNEVNGENTIAYPTQHHLNLVATSFSRSSVLGVDGGVNNSRRSSLPSRAELQHVGLAFDADWLGRFLGAPGTGLTGLLCQQILVQQISSRHSLVWSTVASSSHLHLRFIAGGEANSKYLSPRPRTELFTIQTEGVLEAQGLLFGDFFFPNELPKIKRFISLQTAGLVPMNEGTLICNLGKKK